MKLKDRYLKDVLDWIIIKPNSKRNENLSLKIYNHKLLNWMEICMKNVDILRPNTPADILVGVRNIMYTLMCKPEDIECLIAKLYFQQSDPLVQRLQVPVARCLGHVEPIRCCGELTVYKRYESS